MAAARQRFGGDDGVWGSPIADSLDVFNGHYCQVLISELLYKNYYGQSNRAELLQAVSYFDSLVGAQGTDTRGADTFDVSLQDRPHRDARRASAKNATQTNVFLDARAHYMNGAGYYERDSVVAACSEYLKALEIMETHFPGIETRDAAVMRVEHLPRFMSLIYGRLAELFSGQFMQEPAIVCCKKALAFNSIEQGSPNNQSSLLAIFPLGFLLGGLCGGKANQNLYPMPTVIRYPNSLTSPGNRW